MSLTLSNLLIELGHKDAPLRLTMDGIIATIDAYREANNGQNPTRRSGDINEGPLANMMRWGGLDQALKKGANGLSGDPEWQRLNKKLADGNLTLATLLVVLEYKGTPLQLTMDKIVATIDAYRAAHNEKNPTRISGNVEVGALAGLTTWGAIGSSLTHGSHGLSEDPEWQKLNEKLGDTNITLPNLLIELGYKSNILCLKIDDVIASIDTYRENHNGQNPVQKSGPIKEGPLADLVSWQTLSVDLSKGTHGLAEDSKWQELNKKLGDGNVTLHTLLIELKYKAPLLTVDLIKETIDAYRDTHNGENPNVNSGDIEEGPLADFIKWSGLNSLLTAGASGLKDDHEWQRLNKKHGNGHVTLHILLIELGYKNQPLQLTMDMIIATIDAYRDAHNEENPIITSDKIVNGPLAGLMRWDAINSCLSKGNRGLSEDPKWQKFNEKFGEGNLTLPSLLIELGYKVVPLRLTMSLIKETIDAYRDAHNGKNPRQKSGVIEDGPLSGLMRWDALNSCLSKGNRGLSEDPEYDAFVAAEQENGTTPSLPRYLIYLDYALDRLTLADIKDSIDSYRKEHKGKNPTRRSGDIEQGPLKGKTTWSALNKTLEKGSNKLKDDPAWQTFVSAEHEHGTIPSLARYLIYLGYADAPLTLTLANIKDSIDAYRDAHKGKNPTVTSGPIEQGPLKGKTTWENINDAFRRSHNALWDNLELQSLIKKYDGKFSLAKFNHEYPYIPELSGPDNDAPAPEQVPEPGNF